MMLSLIYYFDCKKLNKKECIYNYFSLAKKSNKKDEKKKEKKTTKI